MISIERSASADADTAVRRHGVKRPWECTGDREVAQTPVLALDNALSLRSASSLVELVGQEHVTAADHTTNGNCSSTHEELAELLQRIDSWDGFNVFRVAQLTRGKPLPAVARAVFDKLGLVTALQLPLDKLTSFLQDIGDAYKLNPYHNSTHAADVTQMTCAICLLDGFHERLTPLELLSVVLAAIVHDVGHPGVSNDFLIRTRAPEAILYNDRSPNENGHCATGFTILLKPQNNFLSHFSEPDFAQVRSLIIDIVLATDMKQHGMLMSELTASISRQGPSLASWQPKQRLNVLQMLLHCADLSNCVKPLPHCAKWADHVVREFWAQGEKERALGLSVSPLCDEYTTNIALDQGKFVETVLRPFLEALRPLAPHTVATAMRHYENNVTFWRQLAAQGVTKLDLAALGLAV